MPPKTKYTREKIVLAALALTRESGFAAVTARGLAARLGCSAKPIFGLFRNMEEVQREVLSAANAIYQRQLAEAMTKGDLPPYKASGMAYIRFSQEEPELFKLLFMRDRSREEPEAAGAELEELLELEVEPSCQRLDIPISEELRLSVNDLGALAPFVQFTEE